MSIIGKIFGDSNERFLRSHRPTVEKINSFESGFEKLSGEQLKNKTREFKERLGTNRDSIPVTGIESLKTVDDILPEAFALVREAAKRVLGQRHFDVQLLGGIVLHQGKIAEMKTGEGKTLVATLPAYLNGLTGKGVHIVTVNDYLSRRDAVWMGQIYNALGLSVGCINHEASYIYDPSYMAESRDARGPEVLDKERDVLGSFKVIQEFLRPVTRREAYLADITYGTNNEFGFDYLRDNLEYSVESLSQRPHHFAIVDEVDSILIDEARTPLIISAPDQDSAELYNVFAKIVPRLSEKTDYNIDEKMRAVALSEAGIEKVEKILGVENIYEEKGTRFVRHLEQALKAEALFHRDKDYVVKDGQVIIVDEFTGRLMPGRRWSEGLHQAVEAKEGVEIQKESRTLAMITFQNYFRMYEKLSGMTGTAQTSAEEFHKVYKLDVISAPTNKKMMRMDSSDFIFRTENGKFQAVVSEIKRRNGNGQPVLVGTVSIEKNERLSSMLSREGIKHEILNAKNHEREAMIIAQAGKYGAVTVATNMAGRGVDILLGGKPENPEEAEKVRLAGGLHVIGTERHEARRIDNQLRGRSGRQGDPGSSQFFVSLEDELMRVFGSDRIKKMMESFGIPEDQPIENRMVSRALEAAQAKIEGFHFDSRKHVLEYDDVLNKQRDAIYRPRKEILFAAQQSTVDSQQSTILRERVSKMFEEEVSRMIAFHTSSESKSDWNIEEMAESIIAVSGEDANLHKNLLEIRDKKEDLEIIRRALREFLFSYIKEKYEMRERGIGDIGMRNIEKVVFLRTIDMFWMDHLDTMEHLRDSVRLRAYGQRDPLVEYKNEAIGLFRELQDGIRSNIVNTIFKIGVVQQSVEQPAKSNLIFSARRQERASPKAGGGSAFGGKSNQDADTPPGLSNSKADIPGRKTAIGRNDPCPCGARHSDERPIKYKHCHGA